MAASQDRQNELPLAVGFERGETERVREEIERRDEVVPVSRCLRTGMRGGGTATLQGERSGPGQ